MAACCPNSPPRRRYVMKTVRLFVILSALLVVSRGAQGQDVRLLDCGQVQFFGPACVPVAPPPPAQAPAPMFNPQLMAPDTPPLMLKLLEDPTLENASAFLAWQEERLTRIAAVQQLLQSLARQRK